MDASGLANTGTAGARDVKKTSSNMKSTTGMGWQLSGGYGHVQAKKAGAQR